MDDKRNSGVAGSDLADLSAVAVRDRIASGDVSAVAVAEACLERVGDRDKDVQAWAFLEPDHVLRQAAAADAHRSAGRSLGPLHGVPVGLKDIIDTADMPTENGTKADAGRRPRVDSFVAARLRQAGAMLMGKAATTEMAYFAPSKTRNPHDPKRTPGGSSSGSAAAVAATMVPLAVGTQTTGSVIRPASFCGVVGFKPTHGSIPRSGVLVQSRPLDTIGVFGRTVEDAALLAQVLQGHDPADPDTRPQALDRLLDAAVSPPPTRPKFALVRSPVWDRAAPETKEAFEELADALGDQCDMVDLPDSFATAHETHRVLMLAGMAHSLGHYQDRHADLLSSQMQSAIADGRKILAADYLAALDWREVLHTGLDRILGRYDAILTPAAIGEAPIGLETTGDPAFCTLWSLCGVPAITLPLMTGPAGMPMGIQVVGARGQDGRLLRTAHWLHDHVTEIAERDSGPAAARGAA